MPEQTAETYYKAFSKDILRDISLLEGDVEFVLRGGNILTACDFSEIYAYTNSVSQTFLSLLDQDIAISDSTDNRLVLSQLHDHIMLFFLFESQQPLWLLDPYLLELQGFRAQLSAERFDERFQRSGKALRDIRVAEETPEFKEMVALAAQVTKGNRKPDDEGARKVLSFLNRIAPSLVALTNDRTGRVRDRLSRLLREGTLVIPSDLTDEARNGDEDTFERWYEALQRFRPGAHRSNTVDAKAVSVVFAINRWLATAERPQRLNLLTRSVYMHRIIQQEREAEHWDAVGGNPLRHPRGFLALLDDRAEIARQPQRQGETLSRWSRQFDQIVSGTATDTRSNLTEKELFNRHVAVIYSSWQKYCRIRASTIALDNRYFEENSSLRAISSLADPNVLKTMIVAQLQELDKELSGSHFMFSALTSSELKGGSRYLEDPPAQPRLLPIAPPSARPRLVQIATPHGGLLPFRVAFRSPKFTAVFKEFGNDPWKAFSVVSQPNMMRFEGSAERQAFDPEWYLAVGFVCAALGAWGVVRRACRLARTVGLADTLDLELLSARATRHVTDNVGEISAALETLCRLDPDGEGFLDKARLASERLKFKFILTRRAKEAHNVEQSEALRKQLLPDLLSATAIYQQVKVSPERCELLNTMVYHTAQMADSDQSVWDWSEIRPWFNEMKKDFEEVYGQNIRHWPDNLLDTYCWVRLKLLGRRLLHPSDSRVDIDFEKREIYDPLTEMVEHEYVGPIDIRDFRLHREEAARYFLGSNS